MKRHNPTGLFQMSIELLRPYGGQPTHQISYGDPVEGIDDAIKWIEHPPLSAGILKRGVFLTARTAAPWVDDKGRPCVRVAAFGDVRALGTTKTPPRVMVCTEAGVYWNMATPTKTYTARGITWKRETVKRPIWSELAAFWLGHEAPSILLGALTKLPRRELVLLACAIARDVRSLVPDKEDRPLIAIEIAEAWARGETTEDDLKMAIVGVDNAGHDLVMRVSGARGGKAWNAIESAAQAVKVHMGTHFLSEALYRANMASRDNEFPERAKKIIREHIKLPEVCWSKITARTES